MEEAKRKLDQRVAEHQEKMAKNPFSGDYKQTNKFAKGDPNYGRPVPGSSAEKRAKKAAALINSEVVLLCDMIFMEGNRLPNNTASMTFGDLFQIYTRISNKVVGILLRARKYGFLDFEGEMLFQRRDDHVIITLLKPIEDIKRELAGDREFDVGICHQKTK